jgi:trehalose 6-phosphate synthase/phosphatase
MKKEIEAMVGRINGKYNSLAWTPVIYQYRSLNFNEMIALYSVSNVGLITPLRDGMNLVAKEYIAAQAEEKGVLILSEMAGAAAELTEALLINPFDNLEMADEIYKALEMKPADRKIRVERMQKRISDYDVFAWAFDFFNQTFDAKNRQKQMEIKRLNKTILSQILASYRKAANRIFFIDYDGTLVPFASLPEKAKIDKKTLDVIRKLADDPSNQVVIISGRDKDFLEKQFKGADVSLVAEHGYFVKEYGKEWQEYNTTDKNWKEQVRPILQAYVERCTGTFIEEKTGSLAWHYRNADSEYAALRLNELKDDLAEVIRLKTDFEIMEGKKVLEVKSGRYNKGSAALRLIDDQEYDFIFAAGDDRTDEFVFKSLPESAFTIKVGYHPSLAKYNVKDNIEFLEFLNSLI